MSVRPWFCILQKIKQVITSLLIDAAKSIQTQSRFTPTINNEGRRVLLKVCDTCCGMVQRNGRRCSVCGTCIEPALLFG